MREDASGGSEMNVGHEETEIEACACVRAGTGREGELKDRRVHVSTKMIYNIS